VSAPAVFREAADKPGFSTALAEMLATELAAGEQLRTIPGESVHAHEKDLAFARTPTASIAKPWRASAKHWEAT